MPRLTFSLDEGTVAALRRTAARVRRPQSAIAREAIARYAAEEDRLPAAEHDRLLAQDTRHARSQTEATAAAAAVG